MRRSKVSLPELHLIPSGSNHHLAPLSLRSYLVQSFGWISTLPSRALMVGKKMNETASLMYFTCRLCRKQAALRRCRQAVFVNNIRPSQNIINQRQSSVNLNQCPLLEGTPSSCDKCSSSCPEYPNNHSAEMNALVNRARSVREMEFQIKIHTACNYARQDMRVCLFSVSMQSYIDNTFF